MIVRILSCIASGITRAHQKNVLLPGFLVLASLASVGTILHAYAADNPPAQSDLSSRVVTPSTGVSLPIKRQVKHTTKPAVETTPDTVNKQSVATTPIQTPTSTTSTPGTAATAPASSPAKASPSPAITTTANSIILKKQPASEEYASDPLLVGIENVPATATIAWSAEVSDTTMGFAVKPLPASGQTFSFTVTGLAAIAGTKKTVRLKLTAIDSTTSAILAVRMLDIEVAAP